MRLLCDRFRAMKVKDEPVVVSFPASEEEIKVVERLRFIEPSIVDIIKNSQVLQKFMDSHCHMSDCFSNQEMLGFRMLLLQAVSSLHEF